jgi:hypothetical protein
MSGYIVNPFSSDIDPMANTTYSNQSIPVVAYGLIGVTSLTLAYLTLIDSTQTKASSVISPAVSATSMLPSGIFSKDTKTESPSIPNPIAEEVKPNEKEEEERSQPTGYGGKSKHKKHKNKKKTKRNKK